MLIGIHQPNFFPWLKFFHKMATCDIFVYLDDVPFTKGGYQNRCKLKGHQGPFWLTVPVLTKGKLGQLTNSVKINNEIPWQKKHLHTLQQEYAKAQFFKEIMDLIQPLYKAYWEYLSEFCYAILELFKKYLDFSTITISSSRLPASRFHSTEKLVKIIKLFRGTKYYSGEGGKKYMDMNLFEVNRIEVLFPRFIFHPYKQLHGQFEPGLSILDALFNLGFQGTKELILMGAENVY